MSRGSNRGERLTRRSRVCAALLGLAVTVGGLSACAGDSEPTRGDVPADILQVRPEITAEEAAFVLTAKDYGAVVTGATVVDDLETGTTTCWALANGGVTLAQVAVDDDDKPLGNDGEALRTKQLMAAGVEAFCPDYKSQISQLNLP